MNTTHELANGMLARLGRTGADLEGTLMVYENSEAVDYELFIVRNGEWEFGSTSETVPDLCEAWADVQFQQWAEQGRMAFEAQIAAAQKLN